MKKILSIIFFLGFAVAGLQGLSAQTIESLKEKARNSQGLIKLETLIQLGQAYANQGNYSMAVEFGEASIKYAEQLGKTSLEDPETPYLYNDVLHREVDAHLLLGKVYDKQGRVGRSIRSYRKAKNIAEKIRYGKAEEEAKKEIDSLKEGERGLDVLNNSREQIKKSTDRFVDKVTDAEKAKKEAANLRGIGREVAAKTARNKGKLLNAIEQYEQAAEFYARAGDSAKVAATIVKIEALYREIGNAEKAEEYAAWNSEGKKEIDATFFENRGNPDPKADAQNLEEINQGLNEDLEKVRAKGDSLRRQIERHAGQGDAKALSQSLNAYNRIKESYFRYKEDSIQIAIELETARSELQMYEQEQKFNELKMEKERAFRNWLLFSLILILVFSALITRLFVQRRKDHLQLKEAFVELDATHKKLKTTQIQLVSSEKMASLGQLTAGIAHEINNPINFISGNITPLKNDVEDLIRLLKKYEEVIEKDQLKDKFSEVEKFRAEVEIDYITTEIHELISGIDEGADRTTEIVKGLRNFARMDENDIKEFSLNQGLDSTLSLLKNQLDGIEVLKDYRFEGEMEAFPGKLNQVFMNILTNAIQAMPEGGLLQIQTRQQGQKVEVCFRDTGKGMSEEVQKRIFEPFYTTKPVGEGTGLGMSISHGIIQQHGGSIEVNSTPGQGTEIRLLFPPKQGTRENSA